MDKFLLYGIIYPVAALALLSILVCLTSIRVPSGWLWTITILGIVASGVRLIFLVRSGTLGIDHHIFWKVGVDIWARADPYSPDRFATHPFLNPPCTFPFFALIANLPFQASLFIGCVVNTALAFGITMLAVTILNDHDNRILAALSRAELGVLATAVALSDACMATIQLGQLALVATALILLAIYFQSRNRPLMAGTMLGLATMKIGTLVPFLMLFHRRSDRKTWLALGLTVVGLIVLGGQPTRVLDQSREMLHQITELSRPGAVNDISYAGPYNESILGFDHLAYRLGVRDGLVLRLIQVSALLLIGVYLAVELVARHIRYGQGLSLVSLYSAIFLYHRSYDATIITPALVYAVGRSKVTSGRPRLLFALATVLILAVLYLRRKTLTHLTDWAIVHHSVPATLVERLVLPYGTWSILLAMVCLRLAEVGPAETGSKRGVLL